MSALTSNVLVPNGLFLVELAGFLALGGFLVLLPLGQAVVTRQWGWVLGILLLGPFAGIAWWTGGKRQALGRRRAATG